MKKIFVASFLFLCFLTTGIGTLFAYTLPQKPASPVPVSDFANILSSGVEQTLNNELAAFERSDSSAIVVVTIPALEGATIDGYATELYKEWGIGTAKEDNGVLLLIASNDRAVRIEVGYGLEGALTDLETQLIIQQTLVPGFREGNYDEAVTVAVAQMIEATKGEYQGVSPVVSFFDQYAELFNIGFFLLFFAFGELLAAMIRATSRSHAIWPGGAVGGIGGLAIGGLLGVALTFVLAYIIGGALVGLLIDYLLSRNMTVNKWAKELGKGGRGRVGFFGFGGGGRGGGGFGGFGGGLSGGGGSSGSW